MGVERFYSFVKRFPTILGSLLVFGSLTLWSLFSSEKAEQNKAAERLSSLESIDKSPPQPEEAIAASLDPALAQKDPVLGDTSAEILGSVPKALRPLAVVGFDKVTDPSKGTMRRAIVSTGSALGRILLLEYVDANQVVQQAIYSAEHLVVSPSPNEKEDEFDLIMARSGLRLTLPFPESDFFFAQLEVETPLALFGALDSVSAKLQGVAVVELDGAGSGGAMPSDPSYSSQWHHQTIDSESAWDLAQGGPSIVVAVLDTGINGALSEFQGRIVSGYDYVNNDSDPTDDEGHGTAVSGVIAANASNGDLVAGVDWNCKIMPLKVLDSSSFGYYSWWAAGVTFAKNNGARVINLSAGGSGSSSALTRAINGAIGEGVVFVTITHNDSRGTITYPGSLTQAITVGATERNDVKASFSNWGAQIDLVAPGRDIGTVSRFGSLSSWYGTSFAAPQVAGTASLLLSINPDLDQDSIADLLIAGAEDQVGDSRDVAGFDNYYGWGRLNSYHSLVLAQTAPVIEVLPSKDIRLSWQAPSNALSKNPYQLKWSDNLVNWSTVESPSISYDFEANWIDDGSETGTAPSSEEPRFYRIEIDMD